MIRIRLLGVRSVAAVLVMVTGAASASAAGITGAGSTLVAPLMANWINGFEIKEGIPVKYGSVGSGAGISQITARTVDFGASDAPLHARTGSRLQRLRADPVGTFGGRHRLQHPGRQEGRSEIVREAPGRDLLRQDHEVERPEDQGAQPRAEAAGPDHHPGLPHRRLRHHLRLRQVPVEDQHRLEERSRLRDLGQLPDRRRRQRQPGVTSVVTKTPGSIGYIEASYIIAAGLGAAAVQNKAGNFEYPNLKNIEEAAAVVKSVPANNELTISDPPKKAANAYPISTFTYAIVPHSAPQKGFVQQFVKYCVTIGQKYGAALDFAPLPSVVKQAALKSIASL